MNNYLINSRNTVIFDILENEGDLFYNDLHQLDKTM